METRKVYYSYSDKDDGTLIVTNVWFRDNRYTCTDSTVYCGFNRIYSWWRGAEDSRYAREAPFTPDQADDYCLGHAFLWSNLEWPEATAKAMEAARQPH